MATLESISAALNLIDGKKENLKKAFDELQSNSSFLSSSFVSWSDLDAHFTSLQDSLTHRFHLLESLESGERTQPHPAESTRSKPAADPSSSQTQGTQTKPVALPSSSSPQTQMTQVPVDPQPDSVTPPRPELRALCERMDGKGLRMFIMKRPKERNTIWAELPGAMLFAADPAAMVLDAMDGFYSANSVKSEFKGDEELIRLRRSCVLLLETVMGIKANVSVGVKERAKALAVQWKDKTSPNEAHMFEVLGLLHLVAVYGLRSEFNVDELVDYFVTIAQFRQAVELCRVIGLGHKVVDLIQKLISKGKQLLAIKFVFEFMLTEKFPPVPLLKAYLKDVKNLAKKVRKDGNESRMALNEATAKEVSAMKSVVKIIESHNLDSEYPRVNLEKRIEALEKLVANRKRSGAAPTAKPHQLQRQQQQPKKQKKHLQLKKEQQQQNRSKCPRTVAPVDQAAVPIAAGASSIPHYQQSHLELAGLLSDCPAPYVSSSAVPYGMVGQSPTIASYTGSSAGQYGLPRVPVGFAGNPSPASSQLYSAETYLPSGYYDRLTAYGRYGVPSEYHPSYYPQ
ncbi:FRIGIDA-like protein 2 [Morella rubra]|uniref:FRIGIDA-like protein n=1 Tax=Morella rubra TaxID=262757 RepID=A0A6A1UFH6_9ROSI|nr:FRIGIDA-like protein 2 [Morella rubra]